MVIWLVGARGMLGQDVAAQLGRRGMPFVRSDLDCDITDGKAVKAFISGIAIDWIVNCSAYTAVDKAEDEEAMAYQVNAVGPQNLGRVAREMGARIVHLSTDYVFDGAAITPYVEDAPLGPRGAYGRTKASGERLLAESTAAHFIVRTAWLYGIHGKNFVATMLRLMNERDEVRVVDDQRGSPTYTRDLAEAIATILASNTRAFGVYHFTNDGETTWHSFAAEIYARGRARGLVARECRVTPIRTDQYPTRSVRPAYSVLSKAKIKAEFSVAVPPWQDGLDRYLDELGKGETR
jgi:dTDP-4-dehydrorhamnose reductase